MIAHESARCAAVLHRNEDSQFCPRDNWWWARTRFALFVTDGLRAGAHGINKPLGRERGFVGGQRLPRIYQCRFWCNKAFVCGDKMRFVLCSIARARRLSGRLVLLLGAVNSTRLEERESRKSWKLWLSVLWLPVLSDQAIGWMDILVPWLRYNKNYLFGAVS